MLMAQAEQDGSFPSTPYPLPGFNLPLNFTPANRQSSSYNTVVTSDVKLHRERLTREFGICDPLFSNALECDGQ